MTREVALAAQAIFKQLTSSKTDPAVLLQALNDSVAQGRLLLWSVDAAEQAMLEQLGAQVELIEAPFQPESGAYGANSGSQGSHHHHGHETHHDTEVTSVSLKTGELNPDKILPWISEITQAQGPNILRLKGILAFPNEPKRYVVQGVHMIVEGDLQRDWKPEEPRESRLVFIGRKLDRAELEAGFKAAAV